MKQIRVLIVDDSALMRKLLTEILQKDPEIEVVGTAPDPYVARYKIKLLNPDVLTLDIEMPRMDGIRFLRNLMRLHPMPVLMVSCHTRKGADITLQALELGAVDFVNKPLTDLAKNLDTYGEEITTKLKMAARTRPRSLATDLPVNQLPADASLRNHSQWSGFSASNILAIGASTGGTEAIRKILEALPACAPATVITQHIPASFSRAFAERLNSVSEMDVCEARDGQPIHPGTSTVAPGDRHLLVVRDGDRHHCKLGDGPPVNRHRPSVDVMLQSVARHAGANAVGVLLTGMGNDGAHGLLELQKTGAPTIAQDENTSVVWGMPGAAVKLGAADKIVPLERISDVILAQMQTGEKFGT